MARIIDVITNAQKSKAAVEVSSYGKTVAGMIEAADSNLVTVKEMDGSTTYLDPAAIQVVKICEPKKSAESKESFGPPIRLGGLDPNIKQ
jgi:hypothetical protein